MEQRSATTPTPAPDGHHHHPTGSKRRKLSHQTTGQPILNRDEPSFWDRQPLLIASHPSSPETSPLQPTTPDNSQSSDRSFFTESLAWPIQSRLDEIELLTVIEGHAETYSSDINYDQVVLSPSPPFPPGQKLNHDRPYPPPSLVDRQLITPPTNSSSVLPKVQPYPPSNPPNNQDNKPYKCSVCPKAFTRNYDLTRHKSSHQDQRPHVCSKCGRSFNRRDALVRHTVIRGCVTTA